MADWQWMLVAGAAGVAVWMFVLWLLHFQLHNAAIVDFGWALGLGALGLYYAMVGRGLADRRWLVAAISGLWGLRLGLYLLFTRVIGVEEEGRYQALRKKWAPNVGLRFLMFFELQAVTCALLSAPFLIAAENRAAPVNALEWFAVGLWILAMAGEAVADLQLAAFKRNPANKGGTCQVGLWHYSRHPNYFFEWLIWVAFALFATSSPAGWVAWLSPALILYFLLRVTGIPATEEHAVKSRGEEYRRYQQTTSAFIPWFPKAAQ